MKHECNFTNETTDFFKSYFQNRKQTTHTQHAESDIQTITHGIPQGSTLATTCYLIYTNDITNEVPESNIYTFADDTTDIVTANTVNDLQQQAQTELDKLTNYFHSNNLVPNPKKTIYIVFNPTTKNQHTNKHEQYNTKTKQTCTTIRNYITK